MNTIINDPMSFGFKDSGQPVDLSRAWPLRACLKNGWLVAQATRLCRSADRQPRRADRPRHPFSKQALSSQGCDSQVVFLALSRNYDRCAHERLANKVAIA